MEDDSETVDLLLPPLKNLQTERKELETRVRKAASKASGNQDAALDEIRSFDLVGVLDNEARIRMREALKQAIERITIYPVKTGPHRKDTIVCGAYIAFKSVNAGQLSSMIIWLATYLIFRKRRNGF